MQAGDAASEAVAKAGGSGPFDGLAHVFEGMLTSIDKVFVSAGIPYSYGFAIIALTIFVKVATFPLTAKQVKSTMAMQALAPNVKELQAKYADDQQRLQMETSRLYKQANVNPLAGCLPTLATIPVFIGLYRALQLAASDGLLKEGFFFIPSLGGPTTTAQQAANEGMSWLFPFQDGAPPLGWETTGQYLILPVLLVVSQYASLQISQPKGPQDPAQETTQRILKFIPLMIGWFSLNVPSGMCIYWLTNNIITTAQQVYLKNTTKVDLPATASASTSGPETDSTGAWTTQKPEVLPAQGSGGASASASNGSAESASSETNGARRSKKGEKFKARQSAAKAESEKLQQNSRGKKKGEKFAKRRAGSGKAGADGGGDGAQVPAANGAAAEQSAGVSAPPSAAAAGSQSDKESAA